jgi:acetyl esterase
MPVKRLREKIEDVAALAALRLPEPLLLRIVGGRRTTVDGPTLDLQTQVLLRLIAAAGIPAVNTIPVSEGRAFFRARAAGLSGPRRAMEKTVDRAIPGPHGPIDVRIYAPKPMPVAQPVLVYYHGGGWVIGDLETHDPVCRKLAADVGCIVVAADYRLAPENKFPSPVDDALATYRWVIDHVSDFGGDSSRVAVAGDSAGGNLAAVVSILACRFCRC